MKKILFAAVLALACLLSAAQSTSEDFKTRYDRLASKVGPAGLGVEYLIERWEKAEPEGMNLLYAKFLFQFEKSHTTMAVVKNEPRYLGRKPVIELKDSTGKPMRYFEEDIFVDSLYAKSMSTIQKAIKLYPYELKLWLNRISALAMYEKESPDIARDEALKWLDFDKKNHSRWQEEGKEAEAGAFEAYLQNCCYIFYNTGTKNTYEAFRTISEKASKAYPKNTNFLNNLGAYWLVAKNEPKKAIKYYEKSVKLDPNNKITAKNLEIAKKKAGQKKK